MNSEELQEASPDLNSNAPDWDAIDKTSRILPHRIRWTHSASIYKYITMVHLCFMNLVNINY